MQFFTTNILLMIFYRNSKLLTLLLSNYLKDFALIFAMDFVLKERLFNDIWCLIFRLFVVFSENGGIVIYVQENNLV